MQHRHLPRLPRQAYGGDAHVHWSLTVKDRRRGWLDPDFHHRYREILLHSLSRYAVVCSVYCLMPDHMHLLLIGSAPEADQLEMMKFLRRHLNQLLSTVTPKLTLQKQAYDSVLTETDRERDAFEQIAFYITENPVRAGIASRREGYRYTSCMVPGYPDLNLWYVGYWDLFWRIWERKWKGS